MVNAVNRYTITVMAVKLVQPGRLADITEGVRRLLSSTPDYATLKEGVREELESLRSAGLVCLYHGQRYVLTKRGEVFSNQSGIEHQIEARRMYLLKESRATRLRQRSGTRTGSLKQ
jgi:hypothetical protein